MRRLATLLRQDVVLAWRNGHVAVVIANSNVKHELSGSEYPTRRKQCEQAVAALAERFEGITALRDTTMKQLDELRHDLDAEVYRRARHVVGENERTQLAAKAMQARDYAGMGRLMIESHQFLRDDYEVSSAELDALVKLALQVDGVYGSRMTGAGFGGCTVSLTRPDAAEALIAHLGVEYPKVSGTAPTCFATRAADGARAWRLK